MGKHCQTSSLFSLHESSTPVWEVVEASALEWHTAAGNLLWATICEDCGLLTWTHSALLTRHAGSGPKALRLGANAGIRDSQNHCDDEL